MGAMSRPLLNRRLEGLGTTIFAEMSARALATGSVHPGHGLPRGGRPRSISPGGAARGPRSIAQVAADAVMTGKGNQYPPGPGIPELRNAIADHQRRFYGLDFDPATEVLVTGGATEARGAATP